MRINIAILDDNERHVELIKRELIEYELDDDIEIDEYNDSASLLAREKIYDILLVDIALNEIDEGMKTVNLYKNISEDTLIIFVTSHNEMSREGYKVNPFRFVYKLELRKELKEAIIAAIDYIRGNKIIEVNKLDLGKIAIRMRNIRYLETEGRNIRIHLKKEDILVRGRIKEFYNILRDKDFVMPNQSYIVNLSYIANMDKAEVYLKRGEKIRLSRIYKNELEKRYWNKRLNIK